jgi:hypothetical protein
MITATLAVIDPRIFLVNIQFQALFEVFYGFMVRARLQLRDATSVVGIGEVWVQFDCLVKIIHCELVVSHVLVDQSSSYVYSLILR